MPCPDCAAHKERADQSDASANEAEAKLATLAAMAARWITEAERVEMEAETVALGAPYLRTRLATAEAKAECGHDVIAAIGELP